MAGTHTTSRSTGLTTTNESTGGAIAERTKEVAGAAADQIKEHGSDLQQVARTKAMEKADAGRTQLAKSARSMDSNVRDLLGSVREQQPAIADAVEPYADKATALVDYIERTPVDQIVSDAAAQVRQRPWVAAAGLFGLGFLIARAAKPVGSIAAPSMGSSPSRSFQASTPQSTMTRSGV